jgi:CBS domain containing-hemolysin-like protein
MTQYEKLPLVNINEEKLFTRNQSLPELVYLDDPASLVMRDFNIESAHVISAQTPINTALKEMKIHDTHVLLITDEAHHLLGVISSEDILGEKPIKIIQSRRIDRSQIYVEMVMQTTDQIILLEASTITSAKIGNIVSTLREHDHEYALVVYKNEKNKHFEVSGLFNISQISKQLHKKI